MTCKRFNSLSKSAKRATVLKTASFIAERKWGPFRIMLYQINDFYTEVFFLNRRRKPIGFKSFSSTNKLEPYLQQIDVSGLTKVLMH